MSPEPRGRRLSIDLRPGQKEELEALVSWGTRRELFVPLVDVLIEAIKREGLGNVYDNLIKQTVYLAKKSSERPVIRW